MTTQTDIPITPEQSERRRIGGLIVGSAVLAAVGVGALAYTATNAAFTGTTVNPGNSFTASTISLTDNDADSAMFTVTDMLPGDTVTDCIEVTYTGAPPTDVNAGLRLYGNPSGDLADNLQLAITHRGPGTSCAVAGGANGVYSSGFELFPATYGVGASGFLPTATSQTVAYDFSVTLEVGTLDEAQGDNATIDFTWEVRSN